MTTISWKKLSKSSGQQSISIIYSDIDKLYVCIAGTEDNSTSYLMNSKDAINWNTILSVPSYISNNTIISLTNLSYIKEKQLYTVFYTPENTNYANLYTSSDGINWSIISTVPDFISSQEDNILFPSQLLYLSQFDRYIIGFTYIFTSTDLKKWSVNKDYEKYSSIQGLIHSNLNILCASMILKGGKSRILTSIDGGSNWTVSSTYNFLIFKLLSGNGIVTFAGAYASDSLEKSYIYQGYTFNGIDWNITKTYNYQLFFCSGFYTQENGIFIYSFVEDLDEEDGKTLQLTSTDGINWKPNFTTPFLISIGYNSNTDKYFGAGLYIYFGTIQLPICFVENTPVSVDGAIVPIQEIQSGKHTIRRKPIVAVTKTVTPDRELICFDPNCLAINSPTQKTVMTQHHLVKYRGKMIKAKDFVGRVNGVYTVPYDGNTLYNVLMETHEVMNVNGMTVETLHPSNELAKSILNATNY